MTGVALIAHRAGNLVATLPAALAVADAVELDLHLFRGRLEVRHAKVLWPLSIRWERWEIVPADAPRPTLDDVLREVPAGAHLWIDLKGFSGRLTRRALAALDDRRPLTVSSRSWWILGAARRAGGVRVLRSVGNRFQRWIAPHVPGDHDGFVIHERLATGDRIARLRAAAPCLVAWAVTDAERGTELARAGVDGLIVDDLDLIDELRRRTAT